MGSILGSLILGNSQRRTRRRLNYETSGAHLGFGVWLGIAFPMLPISSYFGVILGAKSPFEVLSGPGIDSQYLDGPWSY